MCLEMNLFSCQMDERQCRPICDTVASCGNSLCIHNVRVTTCLENLEMSGNLKRVREMSGMLLTVREMSGKKSCHGKVFQNCSLLDEY